MPLHFYKHKQTPVDANERMALLKIARKLGKYLEDVEGDYILIANVDPKLVTQQPGQDLTQLDAILLGPRAIALIEFKSYAKPITVGEDDKWMSDGKVVNAGSEKNKNPYEQVQNARQKWIPYFKKLAEEIFPEARNFFLGEDTWGQVSSYLLFSPRLHPDSILPDFSAEKWLYIGGIEEISGFVFTDYSKGLHLKQSEIRRLVEEGLQCEPWKRATELTNQQIGHLVVQEPERSPVYLPLKQYDDYTIGRSSTQIYPLKYSPGYISGAHLLIRAVNGYVHVEDANSKHGSFLNHQRLQPNEPYELSAREVVRLGKDADDACKIWFEPLPKGKESSPDETEITWES